MPFRVDISPSALQDAEDAYLWIKKRAPMRAGAWYEGLLEAIYGLERMPARCPIAAESEDLGLTIRPLLYGRKARIDFIVEIVVVGHGDGSLSRVQELPYREASEPPRALRGGNSMGDSSRIRARFLVPAVMDRPERLVLQARLRLKSTSEPRRVCGQ